MSVQPDFLFGRKVIYYDTGEVTRGNVCEILNKVLDIHRANQNDIEHLYSIYRGRQAIFDKEKSVREEINNKIVVNFANQIVTFSTGYLLGKPIQ
mgnify:CR=1 FL=1